MNLVEKIIVEAQTDTDDSDYQSDLIIELFEKASLDERKALNELLICICGWEFKSLIAILEEHENS